MAGVADNMEVLEEMQEREQVVRKNDFEWRGTSDWREERVDKDTGEPGSEVLAAGKLGEGSRKTLCPEDLHIKVRGGEVAT